MTVGAAHVHLSRFAVASSTNDRGNSLLPQGDGLAHADASTTGQELGLQDHINSQHFHMQQDSDESSLLSHYSCTYGNIYIPLGTQTCTFSVLS